MQRAWRRLVSTLILPLTTVTAALDPVLVLSPEMKAGTYVHFFMMRPAYLSEVRRAADHPHLRYFEWDGFGSLGWGRAIR